MKFEFYLLSVILNLYPSYCMEESEKIHFTNSYAVHIDNASGEIVDTIARKHGFRNLGQV